MVYVSRIGALEAVELARAAGVRDGLVAELTAQTGTLSEQSSVWLGIYEARRRGETDPVLDANMVTAADLYAKDLRHAVALGAETSASTWPRARRRSRSPTRSTSCATTPPTGAEREGGR